MTHKDLQTGDLIKIWDVKDPKRFWYFLIIDTKHTIEPNFIYVFELDFKYNKPLWMDFIVHVKNDGFAWKKIGWV